MLKTIATGLVAALWLLASAASAETVRYSYQGQALEGFYLSAGQDAPLVMLIHDWDGPTGYEFRRAEMLHEAGYSVFVADIYGAVSGRWKWLTSAITPVNFIVTGVGCVD